MTRRLPANAPVRLPVLIGPGGVADCLNAWRGGRRPVRWCDDLEDAAAMWCWELWARGFRHDTTARGECIALNQGTWAEVINAWLASPPHLAVIQDPALVRVGVAGLQQGRHTFWTLRMGEER